VTVRIDAGKVDDLVKRAQREVDEGLLPSCQLALARGGEVVVSETLGEATDDTRYNVFSATKPFVASIMWQLIAEGFDVATRVAELAPEFGTNGKDVVTVEQVMLHTSGFPHAPLEPPTWDTREGRLRRFAEWRLNWAPGRAYEYHATSAHWVLAEVIERVTGHDYRDELERRVTGPLGLGRVLGIAPEDQDGVAELVVTGEPTDPALIQAMIGATEIPVGEVTPANLVGFNRPDVRAVGVPGGGGIMRACDLALFYQALLHNPGELWRPDVLADATAHVRNRLPDAIFHIPANRTLGLIVSGEDGLGVARGFGHTTSARAFGHSGAAGQIGWADPETGLSFGYCTNGIDQDLIRQFRRVVGIASRAGATAV
jgi:CubicO group peptidase (beta-lactamase class C family)